jgi:hypothetical protein
MATVCELRRFVPVAKKKVRSGGRTRERDNKKQTFEDDAERALADLPTNAVVSADEIGRGRVELGGHGGRGRGRGGGEVKIIRLECTTD